MSGTLKGTFFDSEGVELFSTPETVQFTLVIRWYNRDKWYNIAEVSVTHNPDYPTPAITITGPHPGIRLTAYDLDDNQVYSNFHPRKEPEK